jgi:hypothetical protein
VTIELASVLRCSDPLLYKRAEIRVPVRSLYRAGCLDRLDPEVETAVDVDAASRPGVTGRHEAEWKLRFTRHSGSLASRRTLATASVRR